MYVKTLILYLYLLLFLGSCNENFFNTSAEKNRGYTKDEIQMLYAFAKLALINNVHLNKTHLNALENKISYAIKADSISYKSVYKSKNVNSGGGVLYPVAHLPEDGFPILISLHHTIMNNENTPSNIVGKYGNFSFEDMTDFNEHFHPLVIAASVGFVVYAPDFLGYGNSLGEGHPFMNANALVPDITRGLDAFVDVMKEKGILVNKNKVFITGFSQGGWLGSKLYRYMNTNVHYSKKYTVVGGVLSAGTYSLQYMVDNFFTKEHVAPLFFAYMLYGYKVSNAFTVDYSAYYKAPYAAVDFDEMFNGTHTSSYVDKTLTNNVKKLYTHNFLSRYKSDIAYNDFWNTLKQNSITPWKLSGKLLIIHHEHDELAVLEQVQEFIENMANVSQENKENIETEIGTWGDEKDSGHEATAIPTYITGLYWLTTLL